MGQGLVNAIQFNEDFQDGFITRREAKANSMDSQLRGKINSQECAQGLCYRVTEAEARSYISKKGPNGAYNLLLLQGVGTSLFSPRANQLLHQAFSEIIEHHFPEVDVLARDEHAFQFKYQDRIFQSLTDMKEGTRIEMWTGFSPEQSAVEKIHFFHDMLIDTAGVYLAVPDEENQKQFLTAIKQIVAVGEALPRLQEEGYSLDPEARVFQKDSHYAMIEATRWRREGEDPSLYKLDEEGNEVPSDVQGVVLTLNTVTGQVVDESPGFLPR